MIGTGKSAPFAGVFDPQETPEPEPENEQAPSQASPQLPQIGISGAASSLADEYALAVRDDNEASGFLKGDFEDVSDPPSSAPSGDEQNITTDSRDLSMSSLQGRFLRKKSTRLIQVKALHPLKRYARVISTYPKMAIAIYIVALIAVIAVGWRPVALETNFEAFIRADGDGTRNRDAFLMALDKQKSPTGRRLRALEVEESEETEESESLVSHTDLRHRLPGELGSRQLETAPKRNSWWLKRYLTIMYKAKDGNVLGGNVLKEIRDFETKLRSLPRWQHFCRERAFKSNEIWLCDPGESVIPFAWPSHVKINTSSTSERLFEMKFDGLGRDQMSPSAMFRYMEDAYENGKGDGTRDFTRFFPIGFDPLSYIQNGTGAPTALKSTFTFFVGYAYAGWSISEVKKEQSSLDKDLKKFIQHEVYSQLQSFPSEHSQIYYVGDFIDDHEVSETLMHDILWSIGSVVFVTVYMWIHMKSVVISFACFCIVFGSVPLAYVLTPAERTTLASFSSVFLITVIDIDVIFVFVGFWVQSKHLRSMEERIFWMMLHAGKSCLATSVTTSVSFFANLASCLQPLREFGLLMGLCVMGVYVLAILILPPLMVLEARRLERKELREKIASGSSSPIATSAMAVVPSDVPNFGTLSIVEASPKNGVGSSSPSSAAAPPALKKTRLYMALFSMVEWISRWKVTVLIITALTLPGFVYGIISGIEMDTGIPELFPEAHNQVEGKRLLTEFDAASDLKGMKVPSDRGAACNATNFVTSAQDSEVPCIFHWCESELRPVFKNGSNFGSCFRGPVRLRDDFYVDDAVDRWDMQICGEVEVRNRIAAPAYLSDQAWSDVWTSMMREMTKDINISKQWFIPRLSEVPTVAMENWETGIVETTNLYEATLVREVLDGRLVNMSNAFGKSARCKIDTFCSFGVPKCDTPGWKSLGVYSLTQQQVSSAFVPTRRLASELNAYRPSRLLAGKLTDVHIVWGLIAPLSSPLVGAPEWRWKFDPSFEPWSPWAQRAIHAMCTEFPRELYVKKRECWIDEFKTWVKRIPGERFPTRNFESHLLFWYRTKATDKLKKQLWFGDGVLKACQLQLFGDLASGSSSAFKLEYKSKWDDFVAGRNSVASIMANRAWHTSHTWVSAEAEDAIISSTVVTILIEAAIGFVCIFIFTGDPLLAFIVLSLVIINISGLAFFMIVIMGWLIGPIEVICLVVFVGYSVTFGLHVAHNYAEASQSDPALIENHELHKVYQRVGWRAWINGLPSTQQDVRRDIKTKSRTKEGLEALTAAELRLARTRLAILHVGGAILSAAVSTIGSSIFLLLCTLTIFNKIGAVVMTVTVLSVNVTLISLPAALILFGPGLDPCYKRIPRIAGQFLARICGLRPSPYKDEFQSSGILQG